MKRRRSLVVVCLVAALVVLVAGRAGSGVASAAKAPPTVALKVIVSGKGTLRVTGNHAFTCRGSCSHTFHVRKGDGVVVRALPLTRWKLTTWAGACHGSAASCSLRLKAKRSAGVTFVPPGNRLNPYPLGTAVKLWGNWRLKVNSAIINADQVEADNNQPPPPPGAQFTLVNVTVTYLGVGSSSLQDWLDRAWTVETLAGEMPSHSWGNFPVGCTPPPLDLLLVGQVPSGQPETGNLCFGVYAKTANSQLLRGWTRVTGNINTARFGWFALH